MKKLFLILALCTVFAITACGSSKNEDKTDSGEAASNTDTADTEQADDSNSQPVDTDTTPEQPDDDSDTTDPSDDSDSDSGSDDDHEEPPSGDDSGCTTSKSIGTNSLTKELSPNEIHDSCVTEMVNAIHPECSWQNDEEQAKKLIAEIKGLNIFFGDECKDSDTDEKVECPDFILSALYILYLEGCEVYSIDPEYECIAPCADLYFLATYFARSDVIGHKRKVYVGTDNDKKHFIKGEDETVSFISDFNLGNKNKAVFSWSEKAEDGSETVKKVTLSATVKPEDDVIVDDCFWTRCPH